MEGKSGTDQDQPVVKSWREERRERREARRAELGSPRKAGVTVIGLLLVILGVIVLLQNTGNIAISLRNWGALFILIPAIALFERASRIYRHAGNRLTGQAGVVLLIGVVLVITTIIILLNLNWTFWGPSLIILVGAGFLISSLLKK